MYRSHFALDWKDLTYLLRLCLVLRRVEFLGLLRVVRYRALALTELLRLVFGLGAFLLGRHNHCSEKEQEHWQATCCVGMSMIKCLMPYLHAFVEARLVLLAWLWAWRK